MTGLISFGVAFSGAVMPGPLLSTNIERTLKKGFTQSLLLVLGHAIVEILLVVALVFGASSFFTNKNFTISISFIGSFVMLYMAFTMFFSLKNISIPKTNGNVSTKDNYKGLNNTVLVGAIVSVSNPYFVIWWATIGLGYIVTALNFGLLGVIVFYMGHILGDLVWYTAISAVLLKGKKYFTDKIFKIIIFICAIAIVIFALLFMINGIKLLI